MPRYFFHVHHGVDIPDQDGTVLADDEAARTEAVAVAGTWLKDAGQRFWIKGEWRMRVTDENGVTICVLRIAAEYT